VGGIARDCSAGMEGILADYRRATEELRGAIDRMDEVAVPAALAAREKCIAAFAAGIDRWFACPPEERDPARIESLRRHCLCINHSDAEIIRHIESLKDEVGDALVRIGLAGKVERSYHPPSSGDAGILRGEG